MTLPGIRRARWALLPALALTMLASACGLSESEESEALSEATIANTVDVPEGTELVVAEQNGNQSLAWSLSGAGADAPYEVTFADFSGGPAVIEALRSGAADIGFVGEAPVPIAVSNGIEDIVVVAGQANPGSSGGYYLVAQPGSGIETLEDLRGKRVAYPPGTGRQMITVGLLDRAGLELGTDVEGVELAGSEVVPTFVAGAVDAAIVLGNQYYKIGSPPILGDGTGINTGISALVVRRDVLDDPVKVAAIGDYVGRTVAANNWQEANPEQWVEAYYVGVQGITYEQGKELLDKTGIAKYYPIEPKFTALFQTVSDGLLDTGIIDRPVDVAPYLDDRYNSIIQAQNDTDGVALTPLP